MERFERDLKYNGCDPDEAGNSQTAQMALLIYAGSQVEDIHDTWRKNSPLVDYHEDT